MITHRIALRAGAVAFAAAAAWACTSGLAGHPDDSATAPSHGGPDLAAAAALAEGGLPSSTSAAQSEVLVRVNGEPLTRAAVDERIDTFVGPQLAMVPPEQRDQVRAQLTERVLDEMIVKTLLTQEAEKERIAVSDDEVGASVREIGSRLPEGKTLADYLELLGMDESELNREVAGELRIEKLLARQAEVAGEPTEQEIARFYTENLERFQLPERVRVRHVLIAVTPGDDDAAKADKRARAEALRAELIRDGGRSFAEVAAAESDCPSKAQGGELGEIGRGQMVASFEKAAFAQPAGEIGPVVETEFGFHVVEVEEHLDAGTLALAEAKPFILEEIANEKKQLAVRSYIDGLRSKAEIVSPEEAAA